MDSFFTQFSPLVQMLLIWSGIIVFFAIFEIITPALVSVWFVFGGFAALIAVFCGASWTAQLITFIAGTALTLIFCRPLAKILLKVQPTATNADSLIGTKGVVIETINNIQSVGYVKINGLEFRAKTVNDEVVEAESIVLVERIEGNTLLVKKV